MREYLQYFLPSKLVEKLDVSTLSQEATSFLDDQLNEHFSDVIYSCQYGESVVKITLLLEHKSYVPPLPWLQLLQYMTNAYKAQASKESFSGKLSPVIPIIIYHGERTWKMKLVEQYFEGIDPNTLPFVPRFEYLLTDLSGHTEEELLAMDGTWTKRVFLALKVSRQKNIFKWLEAIFQDVEWAANEETTVNFFQRIIVYLFKTGVSKTDVMNTIKNLAEPAQGKALTIYETILLKGRQEGRQEGIQTGELNNKFLIFKNGLKMKLDLPMLIQLTEIDQTQANSWYTLLQQNPDAEFPQK